MASSYSQDLKLELMVTGEKAGLWGDITNTNLNILQQAIAGREAISVASTNAITLTFSNGVISNGKNAVIDITGTPSADCSVNVPDSIEKVYIVKNSTGGTSTLTIKTASGTGVTFGDNEKTTKILYSDGTNVVDTGLTDLASDFSPQLSADLDTNSNNIQFDTAHGLQDDSGNELLTFTKAGSAVNEITVGNAATGNDPTIAATGETNVGLDIQSKGNKFIKLGSPGSIEALKERATVNGTFTSNVNLDLLTAAVRLDTAAADANITVNMRGDGSNSLNSVMAVGDSVSFAYISKQNATAYYVNSVKIDGSAVTVEYQGGSAPDSGNQTSNDVYTFTAIKTADATFTVLGAQTQFA